jgi:hypothetical protein
MDASARNQREAPEAGTPATVEDLMPGALIAVPAGVTSYRRRFCLRITGVGDVSKATGAVTLTGNVLAADGTTTRRKPRVRVITTRPERLTVIPRAAPAAEPVYLDVQPSRTQIAVMHIPPGTTIRLRYWDHEHGNWTTCEMHDFDHPLIVIAAGDYKGIGWHVRYTRYSDLSSIQQRRRLAGPDMWRAAARRVRRGGVVYLQLEQQVPGKRRSAWVATAMIDGPALAVSTPGQQE